MRVIRLVGFLVVMGVSLIVVIVRDLLGEQPFEVLEPFHFDGVAAGVEKKHRALLARFASKAGHGWNLEARAQAGEALGKRQPLIKW